MRSLSLVLVCTLLCIPIRSTSQGQEEVALVHSKHAPSCSVEVKPVHLVGERSFQRIPEYPGGDQALVAFIQDHVEYPEIAYTHGMDGRVVARLEISPDGKILSVRVVQSAGFGMDDEVFRLIELMPDWQPAIQGQRFVPSAVQVPVDFKL